MTDHSPWSRLFHWTQRRHRHCCVVLTVQGVSISLIPNTEIRMSTILNVGHTLGMAISFFDTNGNPMLSAPTPDAVPQWTDTTPATETLAPAANGLTCVGTPVAPGTDTVSLSVVVGGATFAATLAVEVDPAPQVLGSVQIVPTVS